MVARGGGRIIIVSAKGGYLVAPHLGAYCTGKAAQIRLAQLFAAEGAAHGIKIFAIDPGFVVTRLAEDTISDPAAQRWLPGMVERVAQRRGEAGADADLARTAERCVALASGRWDALSGRYMELSDDPDAMIGDPEAGVLGLFNRRPAS
jgi:NAD(P)-dependent dehydrogenase (short-subunit alcohol dehydrogenase family)